MSREYILSGAFGPIFVNETGVRQEILAGIYLNESIQNTAISNIVITQDATNVYVAFDTGSDLSAGTIGFGYSIGIGAPIASWVDVAGAITHQSITVSLVALGVSSGQTLNIDVGYSLTNPSGTIVYGSSLGVAITSLVIGTKTHGRRTRIQSVLCM
jgi:hypothetical protein